MSIFSRFKAIWQARANQIADELEDPKASLDYSLVKLEEMRDQITRSLVDVASARKRLENQRNQLASAVDKHSDQARQAVNVGREDLARMALVRKQEADSRLVEVENNLAAMDQQLENLKDSQLALERKIALFRSKKEELKAIYDASKAQVRVQEAMSGISSDMADVGKTIQRAEARIREMQSRAGAIEGLVSEGILPDNLDRSRDDIDRELNRLGRAQAVDDELLLLKSEKQALLPDETDHSQE